MGGCRMVDQSGRGVTGCGASINNGKHTIDRPPVQNYFDGSLLGLIPLCLSMDWPRHRHTVCLTYQYVDSEALEFLRQKRGRTGDPEAMCTFAKKLHEEFGG
jgi:hypothetical protein